MRTIAPLSVPDTSTITSPGLWGCTGLVDDDDTATHRFF